MDKNLPRYRQERLLGEGGMGQVHLAIDSHLHRQVAIKTLRQQSTDTKVDLALKEARVLARVNHSNIIQIFNIEEQEQHIALVMEYFNSKTLTQYQHENQITLIQKLSLLRQLAAGLAEAHKNGIVHCDLKPSNILVNNDGHLKIADFGIACLTNKQSDDTQSKEVEQALEQYKNSFGCVRYMSPEQLNQQTVDFRSDIFSFGIIAYQLIVGSHPFGSGAANKVAENIINSEPEHVENLLLDAPDALTSLIMAMLTKVMDKRTLTAADIAHRVKHIENALLQQQIAQEQTTDITSIYNPSLSTESSVKASTTNAQIKALATEKIKQGIMQTKYVLSFCVLLTVLFSLLLTHSPKETESKQVVVLRPVISHSQAMAPMQQNLVVSAVEDALRQAVINTKSMYLISQREVAAITKAYPNNLKKLQQAVGASDIISTELECNSSRCNVKFARLVANPKSENALIAKFEKSWLVPVQRFNEIYSVSQTQFSSLYPEYNDVNQSGLVQRPISEDDYRNYIELYSEIKLTGNYQGSSLEKLEKILQRSPYLYAGYALYRDTALDLYLDSKNQKYLNQLEMVIQSSPPEYRYSIYEAIDRFWLYSDKGELDAAIAQIAEAKKRGADGLSVLELEAYIFFISGRYEQAAKSYLRAFELRPSSSLQYNIAFSYWRAGDLSSAERTVGAMLETVADNRRAMQLQANIWLLQGKLSLAISTYEKIVKNVDSSRDFTNLSLAYALNKQYDKSKEYAQKAFELFPMQPVNLLNLADIEMILGQKELAKSHYQQVVSILVGKNEVKYLTNLAQAYGHLKQASKAVESLNRAQVLAPNSGEVAYASAIVYSLLNEKASAIHHVKAALINNTGSVLFNLPWFDALCNEQLFQQLMTDYDNASRCSV